MAQTLLGHGADVTSVNDQGDGPLHIAARGGFVDLVQMPLRLKSAPDFKVLQSYISEGCVYLIVRYYYSVHR